ncbi:hypothetical protein [Winogradskya humida]|uniref:Uncharacterized protein n=1 Tax=Winogradskya humida TaxID=113566 RepID=A0ABQ3ZHL0_9ACTN|nr:hypothetical protein [Actinoplanes humidus]GIE17737.1 hypothetical protein Ahu01nite_008390 [Actinoplanes humidus]
MTTQIPYGPENADYPQFAAGHAQYPPAGYEHPIEPQPGYAQPIEQQPGYAQPLYPQEGAAAYPQPTPYPQPPAFPQPPAHPQPSAFPQPSAYPQHPAQQSPAAHTQAPHPPAAQNYATPGYPADQAYANQAYPTNQAYPATQQDQDQLVAAQQAAAQRAMAQAQQAQAQQAQAQQAQAQQAQAQAQQAQAQAHAQQAQGQTQAQQPPAQQSYTPQGVYPTNPPWAPTAAGGAAGTGSAYENQVPVVGGLLVPYPEAMRNAARAQPPALWPVAVLTFFFSLAGVVSAARRANRAQRGGNSGAPYWITWAVSLLAGSFVWFVVSLTVIQPAVTDFVESRAQSAVENQVLHDGQLAKANITATKAECNAASERRADGTRDYLCNLTLNDGKTGQVTVTADKDGTWKQLAAK